MPITIVLGKKKEHKCTQICISKQFLVSPLKKKNEN